MLKVKNEQMVEHQAFCTLPYTKVILNGWGGLSTCCYQKEQIGDVLKDDILTLWQGHLAKEIREHTDQGKLHPICKSWNNCPFLVTDSREKYPFNMHKDCKYPTFLEICLPNTHCNIGGENPDEGTPACIMCCRNYDFEPQPQITDILVEKSKPLMPYLEKLTVLGTAEPFWKDKVYEIFDILEFKKYKNKIVFSTNHNGICFNPRSQEKFLEYVERSDLSWSLDAATPLTYQKIRRVDSYEQIIKNLKSWMDLKNDNHESWIYNNINLLNVKEMSQMVEVAAECGVKKMIMLPTQDQTGRVNMYKLIINDSNVHIFKKEADKAMKRAGELGVYLWYVKSFDKPSPPIETVQISMG